MPGQRVSVRWPPRKPAHPVSDTIFFALLTLIGFEVLGVLQWPW
jgi:hypothetical protein